MGPHIEYFCCFPWWWFNRIKFSHRIKRRCKISSWQRKKPYMGQNLVQENLTVLGSQMDVVQMEMDQWLPHLVGTQLVVELLSSSHPDPTHRVKMDTLGKWEGCQPRHWILWPYWKKIQCRHTHLFVVLSQGLPLRVENEYLEVVCYALRFTLCLLCYIWII